jgi:uncharacterized protein YdhG (YjbR/CyaY superfamily)
MENKSKGINAYIARAPKEVQVKLKQVRIAIKEAAPTAIESISYKMPYYNYKGRLAWFGIHKEYIGLYIRPPIIQEHKKELKNYETTKSAIHFPLDQKIPVSLIKKLVKAAMKKNESRK